MKSLMITMVIAGIAISHFPTVTVQVPLGRGGAASAASNEAEGQAPQAVRATLIATRAREEGSERVIPAIGLEPARPLPVLAGTVHGSAHGEQVLLDPARPQFHRLAPHE
ncbi:MAG: hypothetical protein PVJ89_02575 [Planctomycetota bacterium]|jgi:hypothetical protein